MDLENFISSVLGQIVRAVQKAQTDLADTGALINPGFASSAPDSNDRLSLKDKSGLSTFVRNVQFDVAVTAADEQTAGAGAGIKVFGAKLGAEGNVSYENSTVSRVQFVIPLALPISIPEKEMEDRNNMDRTISRYNNR